MGYKPLNDAEIITVVSDGDYVLMTLTDKSIKRIRKSDLMALATPEKDGLMSKEIASHINPSYYAGKLIYTYPSNDSIIATKQYLLLLKKQNLSFMAGHILTYGVTNLTGGSQPYEGVMSVAVQATDGNNFKASCAGELIRFGSNKAIPKMVTYNNEVYFALELDYSGRGWNSGGFYFSGFASSLSVVLVQANTISNITDI